MEFRKLEEKKDSLHMYIYSLKIDICLKNRYSKIEFKAIESG